MTEWICVPDLATIHHALDLTSPLKLSGGCLLQRVDLDDTPLPPILPPWSSCNLHLGVHSLMLYFNCVGTHLICICIGSVAISLQAKQLKYCGLTQQNPA